MRGHVAETGRLDRAMKVMAVEMGKRRRTRKRVRACAEGVPACAGRRTAAAAVGAAARGKMYSESREERGESSGVSRKSDERFFEGTRRSARKSCRLRETSTGAIAAAGGAGDWGVGRETEERGEEPSEEDSGEDGDGTGWSGEGTRKRGVAGGSAAGAVDRGWRF